MLIKEAAADGRLTAAGDLAGTSVRASALAGATPEGVAVVAALRRPWATLDLSEG